VAASSIDGLDVHKDGVVACVRLAEGPRVEHQVGGHYQHATRRHAGTGCEPSAPHRETEPVMELFRERGRASTPACQHGLAQLTTKNLAPCKEPDALVARHHVVGQRVTVGIVPDLLEDAARLAGAHGLRAHDAVQLASARPVRAVDPACDGFACTDRSLRAAAARERFRLVG
jgi:predicted nucleic acid-binding protein